MRKMSRVLVVFFGVVMALWAMTALAANIVVDGNPGDWGAIPPVAIDANEPGTPDNVDIQSVFFTNTRRTFIFRIDTFAGTRWNRISPLSQFPYIDICLDTDNNVATGSTIPPCNGQTGVDEILHIQGTGPSAVTSNLVACTMSCTTTSANITNVTEVSGTLAALGISFPTCTGPERIIVATVYFDNQDSPPDDNVTDAGSFLLRIPCNSLAATLASLEAVALDDHVAVRWETSLETDNLGFNIYRNTTNVRPATPLNAALVPAHAPGSSQGGLYEYADHDVAGDTTYYYWLEDVDAHGNRTVHDPVTVTTQAPTAVTVGGLTTGAAGDGLPWLVGALGVTLVVGGLRFGRRRA